MMLQKPRRSIFEIGLWVALVICLIGLITLVAIAVNSASSAKKPNKMIMKYTSTKDDGMKAQDANDSTKMHPVRNMASAYIDRTKISEAGDNPYYDHDRAVKRRVTRAKRSPRRMRFGSRRRYNAYKAMLLGRLGGRLRSYAQRYSSSAIMLGPISTIAVMMGI